MWKMLLHLHAYQNPMMMMMNYRKLFFYNSFVKLSLITQSIPMDPKHSVIKGLYSIFKMNVL